MPVLLAGLAGLRQRRLGSAAGVLLLPGVAVAPDLQLQPLGERIDAAHAHAVQTAGDFVALGIELAAGVQLGHDHLRRRDAFFLVHVHRNAAAVVDHRDGIVDVNGDVDLGAVARQRFVHGVVDHFVDQVVQAHLAGRADVHGRPQAHRFQTFQHFDTGGIVNFRRRGVHFICHRFTYCSTTLSVLVCGRSNPHRHDHVAVLILRLPSPAGRSSPALF